MEDINDIHNLSEKVMNPEDANQSLDNKPENDVKGEPSNKSTDWILDEQEVFDENDDKAHDEHDDHQDFDDEDVPQQQPASVPKKRKKRRTELENLEITLKGWNLARSIFQALPFTSDTTQQDMMNEHRYADGGGMENKGQIREGEDEDADREFNYVITNENDSSDFLYLL